MKYWNWRYDIKKKKTQSSVYTEGPEAVTPCSSEHIQYTHLSFYTLFPNKRSQDLVLGKMTDSRAETVKVQGEPGLSMLEIKGVFKN